MTDSSPSASPSSLKIYFRLLSYVKPYAGLFALSIVGFLIFASTQPMLGYILKYFVDGLSNPEAVLFPTVPVLRDLQLLQALRTYKQAAGEGVPGMQDKAREVETMLKDRQHK